MICRRKRWQGAVDAGLAGGCPGCLEARSRFLLKGDVFTEELFETYIDYKRKKEADAMRLRRIRTSSRLYYDI